MAAPPALRVDGLRCRYGGLVAVDGLSLHVGTGEVLGLVGPNGAGKTTALNAIHGLISPEEGAVQVGGTDVTRVRPSTRVGLGMGRCFQQVQLVPALNVLDNVVLGAHGRRRIGFTRALVDVVGERRHDRSVRDRARAALAQVGLEHCTDQRPDELSYGQRRRVEIARLLLNEPTIALLDEPTSGVHGEEVARIGRIVREQIAQNAGVLLVEHNLTFVNEVCDRVIVMAEGRVLVEGTPDHVFTQQSVIEAYLGQEQSA